MVLSFCTWQQYAFFHLPGKAKELFNVSMFSVNFKFPYQFMADLEAGKYPLIGHWPFKWSQLPHLMGYRNKNQVLFWGGP